MTVSDQLRQAMKQYGTVYAVYRDSGIDQAVLRRFANGQRGLCVENIDVLCAFFGMKLTKPTRTKPEKPGRGK